jgi:hypothetical protein
MDAATFDRFLALLDKHWASPHRSARVAAELHQWREKAATEARRPFVGKPSPPPLRRITGTHIGHLCRNAVRRLSEPYLFLSDFFIYG